MSGLNHWPSQPEQPSRKYSTTCPRLGKTGQLQLTSASTRSDMQVLTDSRPRPVADVGSRVSVSRWCCLTAETRQLPGSGISSIGGHYWKVRLKKWPRIWPDLSGKSRQKKF